ncbi:MAG: hypothetical protein WC994_10560 [Brumimicrobium sp.]
MRSISVAFLLILTFISNLALAQSKQAEAERKQFIKNVSQQIASIGDKEATDFINIDLSKMLLETNLFSEDRFSLMKKTVDAIIEKRHRMYPQGYNYILGYSSLIKKNKTEEEIIAWHKIVNELLEVRNPRRITEFLKITGSFIAKGILVNDPNFVWIANGEEYKFNNKDGISIDFTNTDLTCKTINRGQNRKSEPFSDSVRIENTSGSFDLGRERWQGRGGIFTFEKVGLDKEKTHASMQNYSISLKATNFSADSVTLVTPYIKEPVLGRLIDRAAKGSTLQRGDESFPQFTSYKADFVIEDLVENVYYKGGFSLSGNEFIGVGNQSKKAELIYYRNGKSFIKSYSDQVVIKDGILKTPFAQTTIYTNDKDSIFHPGLNITYNTKNKSIIFSRGSDPVTQAPFIDTYHKLNMYVEEIRMNLETDKLVLGYNRTTSEAQRIASFESLQFYDEKLFQRVQGMATVNPLTALYNYAWKYDRFLMDEGLAATALNSTLSQVKPKLLELSTQGFITYDTENGTVRINEKTENFVKAKSGKIDYDNISFESNLSPIREDQGGRGESSAEILEKIRQRNKEKASLTEYGEIDLTTMEMHINAVDFIPIENNSGTVIFPENNRATIGNNRDIVFQGWIKSGKWEVNVVSGFYNYENNKFNINESDNAYFYVNPMAKEDGTRMIPLQSSIYGIKGELVVNSPENRAGIKNGFANYPQLISKESSKVFYDHIPRYGSAYDKERFYFEIAPFTLDSLVNFNAKEARFAGSLVSSGIFPKFEDELGVMRDYSLGFTKDLPKDGYDFYETGGRYKNKIILSNNGLQGSGTIEYIHATATSKQLFTFLPDSTVGVAVFENLAQETGIQFPDAQGSDVFITYIPKNKILRAKSNLERINLFNEDASLGGTVEVRESGMIGYGELSLDGARMMSNRYVFDRWTAKADTSNFDLINKYKPEGDIEEDPMAVKTVNVKGNLDFKERKGVFVSNKGESSVEFPANQYICMIDQFTWYMDDDALDLAKSDAKTSADLSIEGDLNMVKPNFFSTHPRQDSLQFKSPKARFNIKERKIYAYEVEYLDVADARIFPDSSMLVIHRKAKMEELKNAEILANSITQYHKIKNATVNITARNFYSGSGDYEYGMKDSEKQYIYLEKIELDERLQTTAKGTIKEDENFKLSEYFDFYGNIELKADELFLDFNGATKINHDCGNFEKNWMSFKAPIDPSNIQIPIKEEMTDLNGNKISVGIRWVNSDDVDSVRLYPTFLSAVSSPKDPSVITASGWLQYNKERSEFQISSKEKLVNRNEPGNFISLHTTSCSLNGDGKISLGMDFGDVQTDAYGVVNYSQESDITDMNITLALQLPVSQKSFELIGTKLAENNTLNPVDFNSTTLEMALAAWEDQKTADRIKSDYVLKNSMRNIPRSMQNSIVITGLKLISHTPKGETIKGLKTNANDAYIVNIFREPVMKRVPLKFFANYRGSLGDRFSLHIDVPSESTYFFDYDYRKEGILEILTSDAEFKEEIENMKPTDKKSRKFSYDVVKSSSFMGQFMRIFN